MGGFVGEEWGLTSCLLSIAQLLGETCQRELSEKQMETDIHLVVITRTKIDHDVLVPRVRGVTSVSGSE